MHGHCTTPRPTTGSGERNQTDGVNESTSLFLEKFAVQIENESKEFKPDCEQYILKLLAHINISAKHYPMLSANFLSHVFD